MPTDRPGKLDCVEGEKGGMAGAGQQKSAAERLGGPG